MRAGLVTLASRIDAPGTAEQSWRSWLDSWTAPAAGMETWPSVVVVAAHPDDEVLGAGGIIALLARAGRRIRLVAVTDGEASHPGADPRRLTACRRRESRAALSQLGASSIEVVRLGLSDTGLAAAEDELAARLAVECRGFAVCLATWSHDEHADHEAAGRAARRAHGNVLHFPIWMWHWAGPGSAEVPWHQALTVALPPDVVTRKAAAIGEFTSQITGRAGVDPVVPLGDVAHFTRPVEVLFR